LQRQAGAGPHGRIADERKSDTSQETRFVGRKRRGGRFRARAASASAHVRAALRDARMSAPAPQHAATPDETVHFYIHPNFRPRAPIPDSPDSDWPGFGFGIYTWTIQTFLRLRDAGFACALVYEIPERGIVIAHRECLSSIDESFAGEVLPTPQRMVVDISADLYPYRHANFHIVQNPRMTRFGPSFLFVRHWPQPGLVPRRIERGAAFRNIAYLGNEKNLVAALRSEDWQRHLRERELAWVQKYQAFDFRDPATYAAGGVWNDYGEVDAIVAVRSFGPASRRAHDRKPASKLYNAWLAGVPAILGRESCYRMERRSELDYFEADSVDEILAALDALRTRADLRDAMVENGRRRAAQISADATVRAWRALIEERLIPGYLAWRDAGPLARRGMLARNEAQYGFVRACNVLARRLRPRDTA
jgi:hypothetical protein